MRRWIAVVGLIVGLLTAGLAFSEDGGGDGRAPAETPGTMTHTGGER